jgi:hypothetical protein
VGALVGNRGHRTGELRKAERVEGEVRDHDDRDQAEHEETLAVRLEARWLLDQAAVEGVPDGQQHSDLDQVLPDGEGVSDRARQRELLVEADHDQLHLAHEQRNEAEEDHGVHDTGLPFAADHALLQQAVPENGAQAGPGLVPPYLRLQGGHDRQFPGRERGKQRERDEQQQGDSDRAQAGSPASASVGRAILHCTITSGNAMYNSGFHDTQGAAGAASERGHGTCSAKRWSST